MTPTSGPSSPRTEIVAPPPTVQNESSVRDSFLRTARQVDIGKVRFEKSNEGNTDTVDKFVEKEIKASATGDNPKAVHLEDKATENKPVATSPNASAEDDAPVELGLSPDMFGANQTPDAKKAKVGASAKARVLDGLEPEEAELFKQMSQAAYDKLYPAFKEYKTAKPNLDKLSTYEKQVDDFKNSAAYQHPEAYNLDPEVQQINTRVQMLDGEAAHWLAQCEAVEDGKPWRDLLINPQTGEYSLGPEQPASIQAKMALFGKYNSIGSLKQQAAQMITQKKDQYAKFYTDYKTRAEEITSKLLPKNIRELPQVQKLREDFLSEFPPAIRYSPMAQANADMFVIIQGLSNMRQQELTAKQGADLNKAAAANSLPQGGISGGDPKNPNSLGIGNFSSMSAAYQAMRRRSA